MEGGSEREYPERGRGGGDEESCICWPLTCNGSTSSHHRQEPERREGRGEGSSPALRKSWVEAGTGGGQGHVSFLIDGFSRSLRMFSAKTETRLCLALLAHVAQH